MESKLYLGFDIGSISINTIILDDQKNIIENRYDYCHGKPFHLLRDILEDIFLQYSENAIKAIAFTGTGGQLGSELVGGSFVNEIIAQSASVAGLYPQIKTVIEMGGEDSKLIFMQGDNGGKASRLSDFTLNNLCAAGTGSFLDQQAKRIGISIEDEFGKLALESKDPPRIAGRCSVFAKSDMIHLQQIATPVNDIVAGLCFAVARNFISSLGKGKKLEFPVLFQGGVAANAGVVRAFRELLKAEESDLIIPEHYASMGAIGALYHIMAENQAENSYKNLDKLNEYIQGDHAKGNWQEPLTESAAAYNKTVTPIPENVDKLDVYLGLDIGSLSTNVVLIDKDNHVIARRYLPTASKPLEAIRRGLSEIFDEVGERVRVKAAGTTGSGRYLTGDFIGADAIRNEITAQATAAIAYDSKVDTIFEIGGQDSKFISIDKGVVVDFEMNKVCAAGTGSFLEEQAEKLDINIKEEFGKLALEATKPARFGNRCTVFMESDLNSHQQKGVEKENLVGGLAYSIVQNYIEKVVRNKRIGDHIFFQGGVTNNKAVVAAFEKVTGKKIIVPPHFDVTGAIGAAILARDSMSAGQKTKFKGFDISKRKYTVDKFVCTACSNQCEIRRIRIEGENKPLFYGGRCDKWEIEDRKGKGKDIPNLFEERMEFLLNGFRETPEDDRISIGIPRGLMLFYQQFPFWRTFFEHMGFRVVLSPESDDRLIRKSLGMIVAETCLPVELMHGHVKELLEKKDVDFVFAPFIINVKAEEGNPTSNYNCPWVQTYPFMVKGALNDNKEIERLLSPALNFRYFGKVLNKELSGFMYEKFGISKKKVLQAIHKADKAQEAFENKVVLRGLEVLDNLPEDKEALVIIGRPYNTGDPALNLHMVEKLINLGVLPVPTDFLPLGSEHILQDYPQMYWPNGQKILAAARIVARDKRLHAVYMGNFRCGADSFLSHFVNEEMAGKPFLELEIDEHGADAGMITRYEAFLDSLRGSKMVEKRKQKPFMPGVMSSTPLAGRTLYFPFMSDSAYAIAAASRACGIPAEVLPMQDEKDLELGRKHTSARECFPMICTTGNFLKKLFDPATDPKKTSFFMPDHNGPCRFGQYNKFQRIIFDKLGFKDVEIISPSNETAYEDISGGKSTKFRFLSWKGFVAVDILRKLKQERKPYELIKGSTEKVYRESLKDVISSLEKGAKDLPDILHQSALNFSQVAFTDGIRKPVIVIVGEIFMRDNPFCSGFLIDRLENLGAETFIAPFSEWLSYSTYRYTRDSLWKGDYKGVLKSKIQAFSQNLSGSKLYKAVHGFIETERDISVKDMLANCGNYVHKHYDGDPALNIGSSVMLAKTGVSGIINFMPFSCMPGTLVSSVAHKFKKDHNNLPYESIAYDGQEDTSIELRLQAFVHQAKEYSRKNGYDKPDGWYIDQLVHSTDIKAQK